MDEISIIERIYDHMAQMEWVELRLPPYAMFDEHGVDTEDVAYLLAMMRKEYDFEITDVPECVQDVVDLVCHREFTRLSLRERAEQRMSQYNYDTFRPVKPFRREMVDLVTRMLKLNTNVGKTL